MKVYVDELPNGCDKCPFNRMTFFWTSNVFEKCKATNECQLGFDGKCELQTLADHDKQVRKEVCEEIFRAFNRKIDDEFGDNDTKYITLDVEDVNFYLKDLVERIGEEKGENECQKN